MSGFPTRLEQVRSFFGVPDRKAFLRRVAEVAREGDDVPSYASVRTYHFERDPPVTYLVLVSRAFGVSLEWLATGEGPMIPRSATREYFERKGALEDPQQGQVIRRRVPLITASTLAAFGVGEDVMVALVRGLALAQPEGSPAPTDQDVAFLAERVGFAVYGLLGALRRDAPGHVMTGATLGILSALLAYMPGPGEGRTLQQVMDYLPIPPKAKED